MADDPRLVHMHAVMQSASAELDRVCAEVGEEKACFAAGGILAAAIGFLHDRHGIRHAIELLEGQVTFLRDLEAHGTEAFGRGALH